jgi:hypothetical protein
MFPDGRPLRRKFWESLRYQHTADQLAVRNMLSEEVCLPLRVCWTSTTVTSGHEVNVGIKSASSFNVWAVIVCYQTGWLPSNIVILWKFFYRSCTLEVEIVFQNDAVPSYCRDYFWQWLNATYPARWIWRRGPIAWNTERSLGTPIITTRRPYFYHMIACTFSRWHEN